MKEETKQFRKRKTGIWMTHYTYPNGEMAKIVIRCRATTEDMFNEPEFKEENIKKYFGEWRFG
jgi:hypothetical protein